MDLISTSEAAARLKVHPKTVARLVRSGEVRATKVANRWLIDASTIEVFGKTYAGKKGRPKGWSPKNEVRQ